MDDKGRKVINVPFQMLKRNRKCFEPDEKPYLPPPDDARWKPGEEPPPPEPAKDDKMYLGVESSEDEENPEGLNDPDSKKRKLHFGGLNFKVRIFYYTSFHNFNLEKQKAGEGLSKMENRVFLFAYVPVI